jgi:hypothetical protein
MFAQDPMPGATPKQDALQWFPTETHCRQPSTVGITGCVVAPPVGRHIASAANAAEAWRKGEASVLRERERKEASHGAS